MAALDFGIMDGFDSEAPGSEPADSYDAHIRYACDAEAHDYRYYFFIEHQNAPFPCISASNVYLGGLARETSRLHFGPMVYQLPLHHPVRLAQDCAMVDQMSRGRLEFGFGYGPQKHEFDRWNVPFTERRAMGVEAMEIILKAWTEERLSHQGTYWTFKDALPKPKPYHKPHPPIWMGAHSHESFEYSARNNFHVAQNIDIDPVAAENFTFFREAWEACGHPGPMPLRMLVRHIHVAETDELARAEAQPFLERGMRAQQRILAVEERTPTMLEHVRVYEATRDSYDYWIDNGLAIVGSPESVIRRLQEQQREVGYDVFSGQHQISGLAPELVTKSMRLMGDEIIPAFARLAEAPG